MNWATEVAEIWDRDRRVTGSGNRSNQVAENSDRGDNIRSA